MTEKQKEIVLAAAERIASIKHADQDFFEMGRFADIWQSNYEDEIIGAKAAKKKGNETEYDKYCQFAAEWKDMAIAANALMEIYELLTEDKPSELNEEDIEYV